MIKIFIFLSFVLSFLVCCAKNIVGIIHSTKKSLYQFEKLFEDIFRTPKEKTLKPFAIEVTWTLYTTTPPKEKKKMSFYVLEPPTTIFGCRSQK